MPIQPKMYVPSDAKSDVIPVGGGAGSQYGGLVIKDQNHLNRLIKSADSDEALKRIKRALDRQGMDSSVIDDR